VRTALKIKKLAQDVRLKKVSFVGNLVADDDDRRFLTESLGEEPLAFFPDNPALRKNERAGLAIDQVADRMAAATTTLLNRLLE
jgi:CO dehydrogenase maturation factor